MKTPTALAVTACLAFAACQGSKPKTTWQKLTETKPERLTAGADSSASYTRRLHQLLTAEGVEHKVVTYQYRYQTRLREEAIGTHSAVLYKDATNSKNPWWLVDDRVSRPLWLPGQDVEKQVAFYLHRKADILEQREFSGESQPTAPAAPVSEASATRLARAQPTATHSAAFVRHSAPAPFLRPARFGSTPRELSIPFTAPAPTGDRYDDVFRRVHGTDYNPASQIDRQKMETLKRAHLEPRVPAATRTF